MELKRNGLTIQVDDAQVVSLLLAKFTAEERPEAARVNGLPPIGEFMAEHGGIFAGIVRGKVGGLDHDYLLIVGPEREESGAFGVSVEWANGLSEHGFADWSLPNRKESRLLFANVQHLYKAEYYWTSEQHEVNASSAWFQSFDGGNQYSWHEDNDYRARAVRRVLIR